MFCDRERESPPDIVLWWYIRGSKYAKWKTSNDVIAFGFNCLLALHFVLHLVCIRFAFLRRFLRCSYFPENYFVCWGWNCSQEQSKFSLTLKSFWLQSKDWVIIVIKLKMIKYIWAIQIVDSLKKSMWIPWLKRFLKFS